MCSPTELRPFDRSKRISYAQRKWSETQYIRIDNFLNFVVGVVLAGLPRHLRGTDRGTDHPTRPQRENTRGLQDQDPSPHLHGCTQRGRRRKRQIPKCRFQNAKAESWRGEADFKLQIADCRIETPKECITACYSLSLLLS